MQARSIEAILSTSAADLETLWFTMGHGRPRNKVAQVRTLYERATLLSFYYAARPAERAAMADIYAKELATDVVPAVDTSLHRFFNDQEIMAAVQKMRAFDHEALSKQQLASHMSRFRSLNAMQTAGYLTSQLRGGGRRAALDYQAALNMLRNAGSRDWPEREFGN